MSENLKVSDAAKLIGKTEMFIRMGLRINRFPFGTAVMMGKKWSYYISPSKFYEWAGINQPSNAT